MDQPAQLTGPCERKASLFREWQEAAELYGKSVAELSDKLGKVPESEYDKMKSEVEITRKLTQRLRAELDGHMAVHGC